MRNKNGCYSNFKVASSPQGDNKNMGNNKKKSYIFSSLVLVFLIIFSVVLNSKANSDSSSEGQKLALAESSDSSKVQTGNSQTIVEKIYVKNADVNFKFDENTIKVVDGKMQCIEDDRILQWHEGLDQWECRKPTHSVFGKLSDNNVKVNGGGEMRCKEDGKVLYWDGDDKQWSCGDISDLDFIEIGGNGLNLDGKTLSINAPTCSGTDKLQWNGNSFVCSSDVDADSQTLALNEGQLFISNGNSVDLTSLASILEHNSLTGLQGGDGTDYYHLNSTEYANITNLSDLLDTDGSSGQVLKTDGNGNLGWQDDIDTDTDEQTLSYDEETQDLSISDGNSVNLSSLLGISEHNSLSGLQGGIVNEYYHLTSAQHSNLTGFLDILALPSADGTANQVLATDGNGNLTWADNTDTDTDDQTLSFNSGTGELSISEGNTVDLSSLSSGVANHNDLGSIQGGTTGEYYHLTSAQHTNLTGFSGAVALPSADGTANQVLKTNGSGIASWGDDTAGTGFMSGDGLYKDWNFPVTTLASSGGTNPGVENLASTNIKIVSFTEASPYEEVSGSLEIDHDYQEGTDLLPHIHWYPKTANAGTVVWKLEYTILRNGDVAGASSTIEIATDTNSTAWELLRSSFPVIDGTNLKIGDQIHFRLYRDTDDADDDYDGNVNDHAMAATLGFHYQANSLGSTTELTK